MAITLKQFIAQQHITASADWADTNPNMNDMPAGSSHWRVTLRYQRRQLTVPFSQGPAHSREPSAEDVLGCLLSDASCANDSFEGFCSELGYDVDSRRAERTYQAIVRQTAKLERFLGDTFEQAQQAEY